MICAQDKHKETFLDWDAMAQGKAVLGGLLFATRQTKEALSYVKVRASLK